VTAEPADAPLVEHHFGVYGGQYVPETLMPALAELERAWAQARVDPVYRGELDALLRDFGGRPTPLYRARGMSQLLGRPVYLKREDLNHTGSHKLNNALGQALLARRMGKQRIIAETGAGQHGVATATVCALLGLECVVYMGVEDIRRQHPNVQRMQLLGASVQPVDAGARTLKEATSAAIRDWVTNVQSTHYVIGSAVGPAPYPSLVRDLQRVIGDEARAQLLDVEGRLPARVVACVGGGSNAIGTFAAFIDDADARRRRGRWGGNRHASPRGAAHGRRSRRDPAWLALGCDAGRGGADRRSALDLRRAGLPGDRSTARVPARQRPRALCCRDRRAGGRGLPAPRRARRHRPRARDRARPRLGARAARRRARPRVPVRAR
jgi:tryptophan synthase beta subunit